MPIATHRQGRCEWNGSWVEAERESDGKDGRGFAYCSPVTVSARKDLIVLDQRFLDRGVTRRAVFFPLSTSPTTATARTIIACRTKTDIPDRSSSRCSTECTRPLRYSPRPCFTTVCCRRPSFFRSFEFFLPRWIRLFLRQPLMVVEAVIQTCWCGL